MVLVLLLELADIQRMHRAATTTHGRRRATTASPAFNYVCYLYAGDGNPMFACLSAVCLAPAASVWRPDTGVKENYGGNKEFYGGLPSWGRNGNVPNGRPPERCSGTFRSHQIFRSVQLRPTENRNENSHSPISQPAV